MTTVLALAFQGHVTLFVMGPFNLP